MGVGCIIYIEGKAVSKVSKFLGKNGGKSSANVAEYAAIFELLKELETLPDGTVQVFSDSRLVVNQVRGIWNIGGGAYADTAKEARAALNACSRVIRFSWISRKFNQEADRLSKEAHQHRGRTRILADGE